MENEIERAEGLPEPELGGKGLSGEESTVVEKAEELARASARIAELEQAVAGKDSEIASLQRAREELEERLKASNGSLAGAVNSYRAMVVQANPEVIGELIIGDTIESINESLERARVLISKVRQGLESEISRDRVPAGAPERTPPDLSGLSPREKIQYAIGGKKH